jgi:hypothetical protein
MKKTEVRSQKTEFRIKDKENPKLFPLPYGERARVRGHFEHLNFGFVLRLGSGW